VPALLPRLRLRLRLPRLAGGELVERRLAEGFLVTPGARRAGRSINRVDRAAWEG
jgi:hypothetical protein